MRSSRHGPTLHGPCVRCVALAYCVPIAVVCIAAGVLLALLAVLRTGHFHRHFGTCSRGPRNQAPQTPSRSATCCGGGRVFDVTFFVFGVPLLRPGRWWVLAAGGANREGQYAVFHFEDFLAVLGEVSDRLQPDGNTSSSPRNVGGGVAQQ